MTTTIEQMHDAVFVDAGNLLSFTAALPQQQRGDVLDSNLFAQLAANRRYSRFDETRQWYRCYVDTLEQLAWRTSFDKSHRFMPAGPYFTLGETILGALTVPVDRRLIADAIARFDALPVDDRRGLLYVSFSYAPPTLVVQASACLAELVLTTVTVTVKTRQPVDRPFADALNVLELLEDVQIDNYVGMLNLPVYSTIRQSVIDKLGDKRKEDILDLRDG
ncbi:MAG: hypothetical protein ACREO8_09765 [Luteimonas sp.]